MGLLLEKGASRDGSQRKQALGARVVQPGRLSARHSQNRNAAGGQGFFAELEGAASGCRVASAAGKALGGDCFEFQGGTLGESSALPPD